ncbi:MAG: carboxypeptidase regulatory-like domain-containing protein [Planctomycetota bacterium]
MPEEVRKNSSLLPFVAILLVAVVVGGVYYYVSSEDRDRDVTPPAPAATSETPPVKESSPTEGEVDRTQARALGEPFTITVRDVPGRPVSGVTVTGRVGANIAIAWEEGSIVDTAQTDTEGRCEVRVTEKDAWLGVAKEGYVPIIRELAQDKRRELEFRLSPGVPLRVRVLDAETGNPLEGTFCNLCAGLTLGDPGSMFYEKAYMDAAGEHLFAQIPTTVNVLIALEHAEHDLLSDGVRLPPTAPAPEVVKVYRLTRRTSLPGRVVDGVTGNGVANAKVEVALDAPPEAVREFLGPDQIRAVTSDAKGEFVFEKMSHGRLFFMVQAEGYSPTPYTLDLVPGQAKPYVEIKLNNASFIGGTVTDEQGIPLAGARVYTTHAGTFFARLSKEERKLEAQRTGPDGRFRFNDIPPQTPYIVRADHPDYVEGVSEPVRLLPGLNRDDLVLKLAKGGEISGLVTDSSGQALAGVTVRTTAPAPLAIQIDTVETGEDGLYRIRRLPIASYEMSFAAEGYCEVKRPRVPYNANGVNIVMQREAVVSGQVMAQSDQSPVTRFRLRYRESGRQTALREEKIENPEGKFQVSALPPGIFDFEFRAENLAKTYLNAVTILEGQPLDLGPIYMGEGSFVEGYALDTNGAPVFRTVVELDPIELFDQSDKEYYNLRTTTDKSGYYRIGNLIEGEYELIAIQTKYAEEKPVPVLVPPSGGTRHDITLREGAKVVVEVLDEYGLPIEGANLNLRNKDEPPPISTPGRRQRWRREPAKSLADGGSGNFPGHGATDKSGRGQFPRKPAGDYVLMVGARGFQKEIREFSLTWGEERLEKVVLKGGKKENP